MSTTIKVTDTLEFPDIQEILESVDDIDDVWKGLISWFQSYPDNLDKIACANKLIELNEMRNPQVIQELDEEQREIKEVLRGISKKFNRRIVILRRQKDLIGVIAKMIKLIQDGQKSGKTVFASLEGLHDFLGIRIVTQTGMKDTPESLKMCYEIMNEILTYLVVKKNNTLETLFIDKTERHFEGVLLPEKSLILPPFADNVKDYVKWIKNTKYQSLHAVPKSPKQKRKFEIQVRTFDMDFRAEFDELTGHDKHDAVRYDGIEVPVNLEKVHIYGFAYVKDEKTGKHEIFDRIGLAKSIDPLNLLM